MSALPREPDATDSLRRSAEARESAAPLNEPSIMRVLWHRR
jgi:hypothetical protein